MARPKLNKKRNQVYFSALDEAGLPIQTGINSDTEEACVEAVFAHSTVSADNDEDAPFETYSYKQKKEYVTAVFDIEQHTEPFDNEDDEDDAERKAFLLEYGTNLTLNDGGRRYSSSYSF
jgi:hypothetical protein